MADSTALSNWSSYFTATSLFLGAAALAILLLARISYESVRDRRLPPGPRRYPFIGNLFQAPASGGPVCNTLASNDDSIHEDAIESRYHCLVTAQTLADFVYYFI